MGNPFRLVLTALLVLTVAKLILAGSHELQEDEAYYFMWAERPALSYYSKGPGIAATMWLGTAIFGENEFGVRFFSPLLALGTSLLLFRIARSLFDEKIAVWSVVILNVTPIFTAGSMLMTIDPLSIFFWVAGMLTFWRALEAAATWNIYWPLTGLCIGMGILAKYTNALQLLSILIILFFVKRGRVEFRRPGFYLMLLIAGLCTLPVLIWNSQNDWITFTHLKERGQLDEATGIHPLAFLEFFGAHFGTYSPLIFAGLIWALVVCVIRYRHESGVVFLLAFSLPIILLYFVLSFREAGEQNWTAPGFVGVGVLLAFAYERMRRIPIGWKSRIKGLAVVVGAAMSLVIMQTDVARYLGLSWPYLVEESSSSGPDEFTDATSEEAEPTGPSAVDALFAPEDSVVSGIGDPTQRMRGWLESAGFIDQVVREYRKTSGDDLFLIANRWQCAAALGFYLPESCPVIRPEPAYPKIHVIQLPWNQNQFSFWPRYDRPEKYRTVRLPETDDKITVEESAFIGKTALYISDSRDKTPPPPIQNTFEKWELIAVADVVREAPSGSPRKVRTLKVFACSRYSPPEL